MFVALTLLLSLLATVLRLRPHYHHVYPYIMTSYDLYLCILHVPPVSHRNALQHAYGSSCAAFLALVNNLPSLLLPRQYGLELRQLRYGEIPSRSTI